MTERAFTLRIATPARNDMRLIRRHTLARWGKAQRDAYTVRLQAAMNDLVRFPHSGQPVAGSLPDLRSRPMEAHIIYYRVVGQQVQILRVLQERMDVDSYLLDV